MQILINILAWGFLSVITLITVIAFVLIYFIIKEINNA